MNYIGRLPYRFNTEPLYRELVNYPEVWNEIPYRTNSATSPHREVDDVWVRYNALENWTGDRDSFNGPHTSVWYPVVHRLPAARLLALDLYAQLEGVQLGAVLITRVPAHKQVYPHVDESWHARYYEKFIIQVRGNNRQAFFVKEQLVSARTGECYWFDNSHPHWVVNHSDEDRISLIVCVRRAECH